MAILCSDPYPERSHLIFFFQKSRKLVCPRKINHMQYQTLLLPIQAAVQISFSLYLQDFSALQRIVNCLCKQISVVAHIILTVSAVNVSQKADNSAAVTCISGKYHRNAAVSFVRLHKADFRRIYRKCRNKCCYYCKPFRFRLINLSAKGQNIRILKSL